MFQPPQSGRLSYDVPVLNYPKSTTPDPSNPSPPPVGFVNSVLKL